MLTNQLKGLRITVVTILVFLALQFEFGMAINLSDPPDIPPLSFSFTGVLGALNVIGPVALLHAILGTVLTIVSMISLVLALGSKIRRVQVFSVLGFLSMALAASSGLLFVLSGFQNDHYSHGMATNFILTFAFYFIELYHLKPAGATQRAGAVQKSSG
jgi:hypothetical protein